MARELERRWERALSALRQMEEDYTRFQAELPRELAASERDHIRALAGDLPALWAAATTCGADRRAVVRLLIERVELSRRGGTELIDVVVHWRGGAASRHVVRQRVQGYHHLGRYAELRARVAALRQHGEPSARIADVLNDEGFAMPRGDSFTEGTARRLYRQFGVSDRRDGPEPGPDERWLPDLATALGVARSVVYRWQRAGYVSARRWGGGPSPWIIRADAVEMTRLRRLRAYESEHRGEVPPTGLTTPTGGGGKKGTKTSPDRKEGK